MKGPFERLKYDLRRVWECPACGHKTRTDGSATTQFCRCGKSNTNPAVAMKLIGDGARRLVPPVPRPKDALVAPTSIDVIATTTTTVEVTTSETPPPDSPPDSPPPPPAGTEA